MVDSALKAGDRQRLRNVGRGEDIFRCLFDHCDRSEVAEQAACRVLVQSLSHTTHMRITQK